MTPRTRIYLYFATLALFAFAMTGSGAVDLIQPKQIVDGMHVQLGIPFYLITLLGVWKLLGVLAILAPGLPRVKEWAYAGFAFDLSGAFVAHLSSGDSLGKALIPVSLLAIGLASWALRPASRRLADAQG